MMLLRRYKRLPPVDQNGQPYYRANDGYDKASKRAVAVMIAVPVIVLALAAVAVYRVTR